MRTIQAEDLRCPWSVADQQAAFAEGWGVFWRDDIFPEIQKHDEAIVFLLDSAANTHVLTRAVEGSVLHRKAVAHIASFWAHYSAPAYIGCVEERMARHCCSAA